MPLSSYNEPNFIVTSPTEFVLLIEINRPEKLNAFNDALWTSLRTLFDTASTDPDVRSVVLAARGRAFTAGLDLQSSTLTATMTDAPDPARAAQAMRRHILDFQDAVSSIQRCAKPVLAACHGLTLGLGVDILAASDVRYGAADTRLCIKEVDIGLAADIGSLQRLPHAVGNGGWVRELALTARTVTADEALRHGLLARVCPDRDATLAAALDTAALIASKSPVAVQGTKFLLDYSREHAVQEGLLMTAVWNASMLQAKDVSDAIAAVLTKSPARFAKL
ncbi:Enoyl-CoA hydratase/isomerase family protein [Taphrina deformans PYCC 5710]|uniref:Enoyl-CoA hydratase/isomerase family protein n=1 Tax=Taphrina deformans (strain PYCC 5710 / ATCC 11124 / CBS 356.35 / IMI 108563 / JCM 9778 / NBRC 8474) TaxID=1097556 RepID=R4X852_TAPDE|nr:Enoyl-CoA hydratase/isomerase family protein [Taphrina deformans PYCC 5710]|eukprot:CCG81437.1 Enoyl-CoA hydratase/isomerase family protein [Taphrina deformans PYCC 5710]